LTRIRNLSQTTRHKEGVKQDVMHAVETYGMYGAPWLVAKRATDGKTDVFFGADKFEAMGWWLGMYLFAFDRLPPSLTRN
jgi:hypothetical protein